MVIKWLKSVVSNPGKNDSSNVAAVACKSKKEDAKLLDIVHEAMKSSSASLNGIVNVGYPSLERQKMKEKIKRKVKGTISPEMSEEDVVEEVTERILDAAEFDPHYADMFED